MKQGDVDVKFTVKGSDWHARGHMKGSRASLEALERVFDEIEKRHDREAKQ